jgi:hypothetical protein
MPQKNLEEIPEHLALDVEVLGQPDETTCGPTALHALYRYYGDTTNVADLIHDVHTFEDGGTLAVWLGIHALSRGYEAILYSCNVQLLDPTWFFESGTDLIQKLSQQLEYKSDVKLVRTSQAFMDFIKAGGVVRLEDLTRDLLRKYLSQGYPILTGLSSTFLYRSAREVPPTQYCDDVAGIPTGHFVILCGYDKKTKNILIADPLTQNPFSPTRKYEVHVDRVICAILLGVLTYDANFLIIKPPKRKGIRQFVGDRKANRKLSSVAKKMFEKNST